MSPKKILLTGSAGQIGQVLVNALIDRYGRDNVIATDISNDPGFSCRYEKLNVLDKEGMVKALKDHEVDHFYHLAAILSAKGEQNPSQAWEVNMRGLLNALESAVECKVNRVFFPSSIAVFGEGVDKTFTAQDSVLIPTSVYGISKAAGENWCNYYFEKYGLDVRSLRYPGVIGHQTMPGGGTTDYAVDIYYAAIENGHFNCFLKKDSPLPMMYMGDAIRATIELMEADKVRLNVRTSYNLQGITFTPEEIYKSIKKLHPDFTIDYQPDFRQEIADSWPSRLDDSSARGDWGWQPEYDLEKMTEEMNSAILAKQLN
ncbi:MAG: NAD-dependent epimerase/dehydratase family protein [Saprospirales bacterium]|nr:MAG: NAD-dependent epimerase/dehydratase family protein [Saprospirales bacterium]